MANNASGDIVGYYTDANKVYHGFLLHGGALTTLDYPGSDVAWTQVEAINDAGDVAGIYSLKSPAPAGNVHGFLRTAAGDWSNVDYPEGTHIMAGGAYGILADGTVVGCYHDGTASAVTAMFGYAKGPKGATSFNYPPGAPWAMHYSATPDGKTLVGGYLAGANQPDNWHGYALDGGRVISFDVPGKLSTLALGVGPSPEMPIVGTYKVPVDKAWNQHGFVAETRGGLNPATWKFTMVDVPDATQTIVRGINAGGDLVGSYVDASGVTHGFLAKAAAPSGAGTPVSPAPLPPNTGNGLGQPAPDAPIDPVAFAGAGVLALAVATLGLRLCRKAPRN